MREGELRWYVLLLAPLGGLLAILWQINGIAVLLGIVPMVLFLNALRSQSEVIRVNNEMRSVMADATALSGKLGPEAATLARIRVTLSETDLARASFEGPVRG